MPKVIPINEFAVPIQYSTWNNVEKFKCQGRKYTYDNKEYEIVLKKRTLTGLP